MDINSLPSVSVITVNYNGEIYLKNLFESLNSLDYPKDKIQIIMVDNASTDGSINFTRKNFPLVKIIACDDNTGFAEGNNIGLSQADGELIAIINNDCVAEHKWLLAMVETLLFKERELEDFKGAECKVGAIGSKIFFYYRYYPLSIFFSKTDEDNRDSEDNKAYGNSKDNENNKDNENSKDNDIFYAEINSIELNSIADAFPEEHKKENKEVFKNEKDSLLLQRSIKYLDGVVPAGKNNSGDIIYRIRRKSLIAIPVPDNNLKIKVKIHISELPIGETINIKIADEIVFSGRIENRSEEITIDLDKNDLPSPRFIINSMGSMLNRKFYAKEIGYEKFDKISDKRNEEENKSSPDLNNIKEVFAIPGTGFLCRKCLLDKIGFFDKKFFTYYEDIDFFWRLKLSGYRNYICTDSVLRHFHCGSGTEWSYGFTYHVLRNRLLMIYKCAWFGAFLKNYLSFAASAFINLGHAIILKIRRRPVSRIDIPIRIKVFFEFFILLFQKLPERIKIRRDAKLKDDEIIKWLNDF
ncbi:MAG: glycosyltransferase [Actinomycetota bacterium]|nr:glycosyltransferase [Actinomycetota bacterium]